VSRASPRASPPPTSRSSTSSPSSPVVACCWWSVDEWDQWAGEIERER
jgi:hypothetical protein